MKILTILIGTLALNMFDASNCSADESVTEAMLKAERLGELRLAPAGEGSAQASWITSDTR